jgi:hypothetical protein
MVANFGFSVLSSRIQDEIEHLEQRAVSCQQLIDSEYTEETKIRANGKKEAFLIAAQDLRKILRDMGEL